jgi:hypothetical protein
VFNNPYRYTDPTGMLGQSERQWLGAIVGIVAAVLTQQYWALGAYGAAFGAAVAGGFASGAIATQSFKGGLYGAFGAALTFGVGWAGAQYNWGAGTILAQAAAGGVLESVQGGSFGNGFIAAGMAAALMPGVGNIGNPAGRAIVGALIGGTLSAATGGKFVNGAVSGAIQGAMQKQHGSEEGNSHREKTRTSWPKRTLASVGAPTEEIAQWMLSPDPVEKLKAARAALAYFDIKGSGYDLFYVPYIRDATAYSNPWGSIELGPLAYRSWSELGVTLGHEIEIHWEIQYKVNGAVTGGEYSQEWYMREVQADRYELANARRFGLSSRQIASSQNWLDIHMRYLSPQNKKMVNMEMYELP